MVATNPERNTPSTLLRKILKNRKAKVGLLFFYLGLALFLFDSLYNFRLYNTEEIIRLGLRVLPYIVMAAGIGYFLLGYLEGGKTTSQASNQGSQNLQYSEKMLLELRHQLEEFRHMQEKYRYESREFFDRFRHQMADQNSLRFDESQRKEFLNALKKSFSENINEDFFKQLNENISIELTSEKRGRLEMLLKDFHSIKMRLGNEIEKLSRKANVNLVIGSLTTIVALIGLTVFVFQDKATFTSLMDMAYHYLPRLSLIIFIEVFAYFFLKLYKLNLNDMKYFQNELTTVELKLASISTAINFGKDIDISAITVELSKTERNFILKKGETTVDLEKSKLDKSDIKQFLKSLTDIANKKQ